MSSIIQLQSTRGLPWIIPIVLPFSENLIGCNQIAIERLRSKSILLNLVRSQSLKEYFISHEIVMVPHNFTMFNLRSFEFGTIWKVFQFVASLFHV